LTSLGIFKKRQIGGGFFHKKGLDQQLRAWWEGTERKRIKGGTEVVLAQRQIHRGESMAKNFILKGKAHAGEGEREKRHPLVRAGWGGVEAGRDTGESGGK